MQKIEHCRHFEIWCDAHQRYHKMAYDYALSLVPVHGA